MSSKSDLELPNLMCSWWPLENTPGKMCAGNLIDVLLVFQNYPWENVYLKPYRPAPRIPHFLHY